MRRFGVLIVTIGLLAAPVTASATVPGGNGRLVFSSAKRMFTSAPEGGPWSPVVDTGSTEQAQAAWSPDGSRLAFRFGPSGNSEVAVVGADGSGLRVVTDTPGASTYSSQPAWTPDGQTIAFRSNRDGNPDLWTVPAGGGTPQLVIADSGDDRYPAPSPDGEHIAYRTDVSGHVEIWKAALDGSGATQVTTAGTFSSAPSWSPDGSRLAFERGSAGDAADVEVWTMAADGSDERRLTFNDTLDEGPVFSPDGRSLVFAGRRDGNEEIYTMAADGSDPHRVTVADTTEESPDWQTIAAAPASSTPTPSPPTVAAAAPGVAAPPAGGTTHGATLLRLGLLTSRPRVSARGSVTVTVRCPSACSGALVLRRGTATLTRAPFRSASTSRLELRLHLGPGTVRRVRRAGRLAVVATASAPGLVPSRHRIVLRR